nr:hypothetical protein [Tanacetum cinerariifolium]
MPTEASGHTESPSLDAVLALIESEMKSDNILSKINIEDQDDGQARPDPGDHDEGHAGPNPEPASSTKTLSSLQNLEKELSFIDQFFVEKKQEEEPGKTNAEAEVQSMVSF